MWDFKDNVFWTTRTTWHSKLRRREVSIRPITTLLGSYEVVMTDDGQDAGTRIYGTHQDAMDFASRWLREGK